MWDENLVERVMETTPSKWDEPLDPVVESHLHGSQYDPLIRKVLVEGINQTWAGEVESWIQCPPISGESTDQVVLGGSGWKVSDTDDEAVCPWSWSSPIHQLTCDWVWPKELDQPPYNEPQGPLLELDTHQYAGKVTEEWVVEKLFAKGGLRLAAILNLIFVRP